MLFFAGATFCLLLLIGLFTLSAVSENLYTSLSEKARRFLQLHNISYLNCTRFLPDDAVNSLRNLEPKADQTLSHYFLHQCLNSKPYDKKFSPLLFAANYNPNLCESLECSSVRLPDN